MALINIDLSGVTAALVRIARALEHFVEDDRIATEAELRRRARKPRPVEFGTMDFDAAQARYDHERVEDGFDVDAERERGDGR